LKADPRFAALVERLVRRGLEVTAPGRLSEFTTFRLGGPCPAVITCRTPAQLEAAVRELAAAEAVFDLVGGGSNVLVSDAGLDRPVLRYATDDVIARRSGDFVEAAGCAPLDGLVLFTIEEELDGLVCCSGIPGTVGGAVVGNAGAFGRQIGDCAVSVRLMDREGRPREAAAGELGFAYRSSRLQQGSEAVVAVRLKLAPGDRRKLRAEREEILALRRDRHPDWRTVPTAGSFFRNVEPTSKAGMRQAAGWFLDQAGAKDLRVGGARVYEKHANIIVGDAGCRAQDVLDLSRRMAEAVRRKFDLVLAPEVKTLGPFA
jgi:UDP-N-acetylmuramate dehydrogenase